MKPEMRTRIALLSRLTLMGLALVAGLVAITARLPSASKTEPPATSPIHAGREGAREKPGTVALGTPYSAPASPTIPSPTAQPTAQATATDYPPEPTVDVSNRIGILAGHLGFDTGAVCADGLREVDITRDIAQRVAAQLRALGYRVDILQEHDPDVPQPPLQNYHAAVFVALHADSCTPGASGFKVARWAFSQMPEIEDRLVQCLYREYAATTGLPRHDASITIDMWNYYARSDHRARVHGR
jgi:N-acetylmuramoyl-L-alanine amidase